MANIFGTLTLVVLLVSAFMAFKSKSAYENEIVHRQRAQTEREISRTRLQSAQEDVRVLTSEQEQLASEIETLTSEEVQQRTANQQATDQITAKESEVAANRAQLEDIREKTERTGDIRELAGRLQQIGQEIEQLDQGISSTEAQLANLTAENRRVEGVISGYREEEARISRSESAPGLSASISSIYTNWGFVTLGAGNNSGVVANSTLDVVRGGETIAKLMVTAVEANTASATIVPDTLREDTVLMVGDRVVPGTR